MNLSTTPHKLNLNLISAKEFDAICRQLSIKVERVARAKLAEHGYIGLDLRSDAYTIKTENGSKLFPVYNGGNDQTIYTNPVINLLARAWHDLLHIELQAEFTPEGEMIVAVEQVATDENGTLVFDAMEMQILLHEVVSQVAFEKEYGVFPVNQKQFIRDCLNYDLSTAKILCAAQQGLFYSN